MSTLEKNWRFAVPVYFLTAFCTFPLLDSAGVVPVTSVSQALVTLICFTALSRLFFAIGKLFTIIAFPSSKLLD